MANYTPVIATAQGALTEFVEHEKNGALIPLPTDEFGEWIHNRDDARRPLWPLVIEKKLRG